jgi:hypothetical protein
MLTVLHPVDSGLKWFMSVILLVMLFEPRPCHTGISAFWGLTGEIE